MEVKEMYPMYSKVQLPETGETVSTGWLQPLPDLRDYTDENPELKEMIKMVGGSAPKNPKFPIPNKVDLRKWCSPIENQGNLGSCSAHAGMGIVEYFEKRAFGIHIDGSRLFLYKTTRNLMKVTGDTGAWLRNVMGALALCGVPAEEYWPYIIPDFDKEPTAFVYSIADNYEAIKYFCHDPLGSNTPGATTLFRVKLYLARGIPSMFGFFGFPSFNYSNVKGGIPFPCPGEKAQWGHAIVAVGYDDNMKIKNLKCNKETKGALLIRNSWGVNWGDQGYGWLPYEYVINKLAVDFWSLLKMDWVNTKQFGL